MNCKKYGYFTSMFIKINKKVKANLYLVDAQEICQLESFSQSLHATQGFIADCPGGSDHSEPFFICEIKGKCQNAITSSNNAKKRLHSYLPVTTCTHHKKLTYLRSRLDTAVDVDVMSASVYKSCSIIIV